MFHGTLSIITKIRPEAVEGLTSTLRRLDRTIQARQSQPLRAIHALYFAHWGILGGAPWDGPPAGPREDCYLLFGADLRLSASLHGREQLRASLELLVDALAAQSSLSGDTTFDELYAHCEGYPEEGLARPTQVKEYLLKHAVPYSTRHVDFAYRVASVPAIRELQELRARAEAYLNNPHRRPFLERLEPTSLYDDLREHLDPHLARVTTPEWSRNQSAALIEAALATLTYLFVDKPLRLLVQLKNRFARPLQTVEHVTIPDALREEIEARQGPIQNSMILVTDVPDSALGRLRQRFFMGLVNWRLKRNLVGMNDMRVIHFARWAIFQRGAQRQLLFIVTYDESWEAYIDAFVNHEDVSNFLKLIWSGSKGFPSGRPFVEPFKEWIRGVQCPTLVHYSALLHGEAPPTAVAVTDLHEALELRRVLTLEDLSRPENEPMRQSLKTYLEQGRFPYQEKLLSLRQAFSILQERLRSIHLRPTQTLHRRTPHVTARKLGVLRAQTPLRSRRSEGHSTPASREAGRRPGAHRPWLQAHGDRRLSAVEDPGRGSVPSVDPGDAERGTHDGGGDPQ
ncbi:hypothetical protein D187_004734 [Cystobacter fuscus DSM 2262]|uniref:Uncharacterized protein n=1 Tax=Cystobacter fuscus (strain ATCC 25194 / DSM 2262 / NBRC 100088 / M29) TaxID=1242864 RepID=S9Q8Q3_CYSF2|nr:hypothetical protein [Cystobacter fuscus]EPX57714.1 hypothetical protein D187_004734 [Cystobacter fuscus DSM 2262]